MKKFVICMFALFAFAATGANAQTDNDASKTRKEMLAERKEIRKASKAELDTKAVKQARKEAKRLKKEGWKTSPGAIALEKQLDKSYLMQMEYDEDLYPKYIMAEAVSVGGNYDAAKMQAMELAKISLAGQIQTEVTALIENSVSNKQLGNDEAVSVTKSIMAAKNLISQSLGRTIPVMECYRLTANGNHEVLVRIAYNGDMAKAAAKRAIQEQLESEGDALQKKLDDILGW